MIRYSYTSAAISAAAQGVTPLSEDVHPRSLRLLFGLRGPLEPARRKSS